MMKGAYTPSSSSAVDGGDGSSSADEHRQGGVAGAQDNEVHGPPSGATTKAPRIDDSTDTNLTVAAGSVVLVRLSDRHVAYHHALVLDVTDSKVNIQRTCATEEESVPTNPDLFKLIPKRYVRSSIRQRLFDKIVSRQPEQATILRKELLLERLPTPVITQSHRTVAVQTPTPIVPQTSAVAGASPDVSIAPQTQEPSVGSKSPAPSGSSKSLTTRPDNAEGSARKRLSSDKWITQTQMDSGDAFRGRRVASLDKTPAKPVGGRKSAVRGKSMAKRSYSDSEESEGLSSDSLMSVEEKDFDSESDSDMHVPAMDVEAAPKRKATDGTLPMDTGSSTAPVVVEEQKLAPPAADHLVIEAGEGDDLNEGGADNLDDLALKTLAIYRENVEKFLEPRILAKIDAKRVAVTANSDPFSLSNIKILKQPLTIENCTMRDYQLEGLSWLAKHYEMGLNCILADEMGLGKTLQIISLMSHVLHTRKEQGMHLVVTPLSTLFNWMQELKNFCPSLKVSRLHFRQAEVTPALKKQILSGTHADVYVTSYEMVKSPALKFLQRIDWRTITLDEGHRIKNENSLQSEACVALKGRFKVILTGTPVQNNLHELFAVLHFLHPKIFTTSAPFDKQQTIDPESVTPPSNSDIISDAAPDVDVSRTSSLVVSSRGIDKSLIIDAKKALYPFILRRLKSEVEKKLPPKIETRINCPMTELQRLWARRLLLRNAIMMQKVDASLVGAATEEESKKLMNSLASMRGLLMQLRKAANHPFMFPGVESTILPNGMPTEEIVSVSGKMQMLDRLLPKLKERGHRVVIFSQFTTMLNILEDYLHWRRYSYYRVDGSSNRVMRGALINLYNKPGSEQFIFLSSTRAGGEGINLYTADTVILFDSDWNPQADAQACGRVHRIGQSKVVHIYRLVTSGSVEERMIQCAQRKLLLGTLITASISSTSGKIAGGGGGGGGGGDSSSADAEQFSDDKDPSASLTYSFLKFGWNRLFTAEKSNVTGLTDAELDLIIDRSPEKPDVPGKEASSSETSQLMLENQDVSVDGFDINEPLVPVRHLEGEKIEDVQFEEVLEGDLESRRNRRGKDSSDSSKNRSTLMVNMGSQSGGRQIAGRDFNHQDFCQNCWDGGDLIVCDFCPGAYHNTDECIPTGRVDENMNQQWACPHHACFLCNRKADATGVMFRCEVCPCAYCEDCLPIEHEMVGQSLRLELLGYHPKGSVLYIQCSPECIKFAKHDALEFLRELAVANKQASGELGKASVEVEDGAQTENAAKSTENGSWRSKEREAMKELVGRSAHSAIQHCTLKNLPARLRRSRNVGLNPSPTAAAKFSTLDEIPGFRRRYSELHPRNRAALANILSSIDSSVTDLSSQHDAIFGFSGASTTLEDPDIADVFLRTLSVVRPYPSIDLSAIGRALGLGEMTPLVGKVVSKEPKFRFIGDAGLRKAMLEEVVACFLVTLHPQNMLVGRKTIEESDALESDEVDEVAHPEWYPFCICRWLEALVDHAVSNRGHMISRGSYKDAIENTKGIWSWSFSPGTSPPSDSTLCQWMAPGFRLYKSLWSQRCRCLISPNLRRLISEKTDGGVPSRLAKNVAPVKPVNKTAEVDEIAIVGKNESASEDDGGSVYSAKSCASSSSDESKCNNTSDVAPKKRLRPVADAELVPAAKITTLDAGTQSRTKEGTPSSTPPLLLRDEILKSPLGAMSIQFLSDLPTDRLTTSVRSLFINLISGLHQNLHVPAHMSAADEKWVFDSARTCGEYVQLMQRASIALGRALAQRIARLKANEVFSNRNTMSQDLRISVSRILSVTNVESISSQVILPEGHRREAEIYSKCSFDFREYQGKAYLACERLCSDAFVEFVSAKLASAAGALVKLMLFGETLSVESAPKKRLKPIHPHALTSSSAQQSPSTDDIGSSHPPSTSNSHSAARNTDTAGTSGAIMSSNPSHSGASATTDAVTSTEVYASDQNALAAPKPMPSSQAEASDGQHPPAPVSAPLQGSAYPSLTQASSFVNPISIVHQRNPGPNPRPHPVASGNAIVSQPVMPIPITATSTNYQDARSNERLALPVCTAPVAPISAIAPGIPQFMKASVGVSLRQVAVQNGAFSVQPNATVEIRNWNFWDRYLLFVAIKAQHLFPKNIATLMSHMSSSDIWAALTSLGEADIAAILSGDLSALRLPRVGHMEVYVPAILRDPNGALLNSVDTPVELQKWALSLQPLFSECMANRAILSSCMSRLSGDEAVYIRGLYDLIILFNKTGIPMLDMNSVLVIRRSIIIAQNCIRGYMLDLVIQLHKAVKFASAAALIRGNEVSLAHAQHIAPIMAKLKALQCNHLMFYVDPSVDSNSPSTCDIPLSVEIKD